MVHLIGNYYAEPNNMGFTLLLDRGTKDKDGNPQYATLGYCASFENTIFLLKRKVVDHKLKNGSYELSEAIDIIKQTTKEITDAMKGVWL